MSLDLVGFDQLELVQQCLSQLDEMIHLLNGGQLRLRVHNLGYLIYLDQISRSGQLDSLDLLLCESVPLLILSQQHLLLLGSRLPTLIDEEPALPHTLLLGVVLEYLVDVHMQAHEPRETLLPHQPLSLQVALLNRLGRKYLRLLNPCPLTHPEFHQS